MSKGSVVQPWVNELSWKKQTVLFCALRGPDSGGHVWLKSWTRWIRRNTLQNAAPRERFMRPETIKPFKEIAEDSSYILDMLSVHYLSHLMHALQIIGNHHPVVEISLEARVAYYHLCDHLHLRVEPEMDFHLRLCDASEEEEEKRDSKTA